jgi:hypothetical protein
MAFAPLSGRNDVIDGGDDRPEAGGITLRSPGFNPFRLFKRPDGTTRGTPTGRKKDRRQTNSKGQRDLQPENFHSFC